MPNVNRNDLPTAFGKQTTRKKRNARGNTVDQAIARETVEKLFNKVFKFKKTADSRNLPDPTKTFESEGWNVTGLHVLKSELNFHKSQLNDYRIDEWSAHTRKRNIAGDLRWRLKALINPEFLTQAWTKFYECASKFEIIPSKAIDDGVFNSVHLCEAPGAFVISLNHFLKSNYKHLKWGWLASTLNPYYEGNSLSNMIHDDRFMFYTLDNWDFGLDSTGDIMSWENSQALITKAKRMGDVHLVTADGSIDCMMNPAEQEQTVAPLHFCEVVTALQVLAEGGTFICKIFTMFEHPAVCIMYLLHILFDDVSVFKPATSKEGNSEVYIVCLKYAGRDILSKHFPYLQKGYNTDLFSRRAIFSLNDIPATFLMNVKLCAGYFNKLQCSAIDNNVYFYGKQNIGNNCGDFKYLKSLKNAFVQEYINVCGIRSIPVEEEILKGMSHSELKLHQNLKNLHGSYTERVNFQNLPKPERVDILNKDILRLGVGWPHADVVEWVTPHDRHIGLDLQFTHGKTVHKLNSSKFVAGHLFKLFTEIKDLCALSPSSLNSSNDEELQDFNSAIGYLNPETVTYLKFKRYNIFGDFNLTEKLYFDLLRNKLKLLREKDSLVILNFCVLSHFSVGILYLLSGKFFEKVGFCKNGLIILCNLTNRTNFAILDAVFDEIIESNNVIGKTGSILGVLPVQLLENGPFYSTILDYNNNLLQQMSQKLVDIYTGRVINCTIAAD